MSTGPHLHYEVIINKKKANSQKLKLPSGKILKDNERTQFEIHRITTDVLIAELFEKYNTLAKEAMSSGDKTLGENYLQHADHFMRVVEDKSKDKDQSKANVINKSTVDDKRSSENSEIKQEDVTKNQE